MCYLIPTEKLDRALINKKKRTCQLVDFAVTAKHSGKIKENEKIGKYVDFARELKKLWNIQKTVIPVVIGVLVTIPKNLEKILEKLEIRGRIETIQTTALLRSARIPRRIPETQGHLLSPRL